MDKFKEIRPISLAIIEKNGKILVQEGYKEETKEYYYRPLGGGIEFLERAEDALVREFQEEIHTKLTNIEYITLFENIFKQNGKDAHELILLYRATMPEEDYQETYDIDEIDHVNIAKWVEVEDFKQGKKRIYPLGIEQYL